MTQEYDLFVERGWTPEEYQAWLTSALSRDLLR
jgi:hypothetical protein